jgi:hypothetical protein
MRCSSSLMGPVRAVTRWGTMGDLYGAEMTKTKESYGAGERLCKH